MKESEKKLRSEIADLQRRVNDPRIHDVILGGDVPSLKSQLRFLLARELAEKQNQLNKLVENDSAIPKNPI